MGKIDSAFSAVARIEDAGGVLRGTGFFIDDKILLTCDHVVAGVGRCRVVVDRNIVLQAQLDETLSVPDLDVAVLRTDGDCPAVAPASRMEVPAGERLWTRGFQLQSSGVRGAVSFDGMSSSLTTVSYPGRQRTYDISGALQITNLTNPGASGGPLIVREGVAVALVTSKFGEGGGFGIPLSLVAARSPTFATFIDAQSERVPAFGRYLNRAAGRMICAQTSDRVVNRLADRGLYLRQYFVERHELHTEMEKFRAQNEHSLMIVVGVSGAGKSSAMAALAEQPPSPFTILLGADHFRVEDASLRENLAREARIDTEDTDRLARVAADELLIIVDGLDALRGSVDGVVRPWIERTLEWLGQFRGKLVVTVRDDFWKQIASVVPRSALYAARTGRDRDAPPVELGPFDDQELRQVRALYGLDDLPHSNPLVRLPFAARLQMELGARVGKRVGIAALIDQFISEKAKAVSRVMTPALPPAAVRVALRQLAACIEPAAGLALSADDFYTVFAAHPAMANAVLSEHLVVETGSGFRFGFDSVAEWLASEQLQLPAASGTAWLALLATKPWLGRLRLAVLAQEGTPRFDATVRAIVAASEAASDREISIDAGYLAASVLNDARVVTAEHVALLADCKRGGRHPPHSITELVDRANLTARQRVRIARMLAPFEDSYPWERGHWLLQDRDWFLRDRELLPGHAFRPFMAIVADALERDDSRDGIDELLTWLGDLTPLSSASARVEEIAAAFLFQYRGLAFDSICDALARLWLRSDDVTEGSAHQLLQDIAGADARIVPVLKRWSDQASPAGDEMTAMLLGNIIRKHKDAESVRLFGEIVSALIARDVGVAGSTAIASAGSLDGFDLLAEVGRRFSANAPGVSGYAFRPYLRNRFDEVTAILRHYFLQPQCDASSAEEVLIAMATANENGGEIELIRFLEEVFDTYPALRSGVGRALEHRLHEVSIESEAWEPLVLFTQRVIREAPLRGVAPLRYFLAAHEHDDGKEGVRRALILLYIEESPHREAHELLFPLLAKRYSPERAEFETVLRLAERIDGEPWGDTLCQQFAFAPRLLEVAATRVRADPRVRADVRNAIEAEIQRGATPERALLRVLAPWSSRGQTNEA